MSACADYAAEQWELADTDQPGPGDMPGCPDHAEAMRAEILALPRWAWIYLPESGRASTCHVCRQTIPRLAPIYVTRSGKRMAWHAGCCSMMQDLHAAFSGGSRIFPSIAHGATGPADAVGATPTLRTLATGDTPDPCPAVRRPTDSTEPGSTCCGAFLLPKSVPVLVGAPGRRMVPEALTVEVIHAD